MSSSPNSANSVNSAKNINTNSVNTVKPKRKFVPKEKIDDIADRLVEKFNSPSSRLFYCKLAWSVDENTISQMAAKAEEVATSSSVRYFNKIAKIELNKEIEKYDFK